MNAMEENEQDSPSLPDHGRMEDELQPDLDKERQETERISRLMAFRERY